MSARGRAPVRRNAPAAPARTGLAGAAAAEVVGTFLLVFIGTGTVVAVLSVDPEASANLSAIALAFGFAVAVAVYAFGHVSGAHINPTVTVGLALVRKFPWSAVPVYLAAQLAGGVLASLVLWGIFGAAGRGGDILLGATAPGDAGAWVAFLTEVVLGFLLLVVVLATATDERASPAMAGLAIGLVIAGGVYVAAQVSGGSFNAVRSLAPMIVSGEFPGWWVYLIAPALGGALGAFCYEHLIRRGSPPEPPPRATVDDETLE